MGRGSVGGESETKEAARAIAKLRETTFDLMVSDIRMDPVDGMEVLAAARRLNPNMPVIMLTAYDSPDARQKAKELGACGFVTKPFEVDDLLSTVDRALEECEAGDGPDR